MRGSEALRHSIRRFVVLAALAAAASRPDAAFAQTNAATVRDGRWRVLYMRNRGGLSVERDGDPIAGTEQTLDWVDALAGARVRVGLGDRVALHGRADVAGFGSDFSWNVQGGLEVRLGERWKTGAGYRYLDVDYDKGDGLERRIWQVA